MTTEAGGRVRPRRRAKPAEADAAAVEPGGAVETAPPKARGARPGMKALAAEHWRALTALGLLILGAVIILLGWYGTAYTNIFTEQIPYLVSGGLLGLGLIIVAGFMAVSSIQAREIRELRRDLMRVLESLPAGGGGGAPRTSNGSTRPDGRVYVVAGGRSFHVPGCPILEGKETEGLAPARAADAGYVACKLCGPD